MPKPDSQTGKLLWQGRAALRPGLGFFDGNSGDNRLHRHWAHQLSFGRNGPIELISHDQHFKAPAVFIRADTPHQLQPGAVLSIYLDPTSLLARQLCTYIDSAEDIVTLSEETVLALLPAPAAAFDIESLAAQLERAVGRGNSPVDNSRLTSVLHQLESGIRNDHEPALDALAAVTSLSKSRFSHRFKEQTGMPLRSYRKWLHLILGLEKTLQGQSLTTAAHEARFADQAHFSRTFQQAFGISPSDVLKLLYAANTAGKPE